MGATGDVYVCCYTYGQPEFKYGNIAGANADYVPVVLTVDRARASSDTAGGTLDDTRTPAGTTRFESVWQSAKRRELAASITPRACTTCRHNAFNLLVERLAALPAELQDTITQTMSDIIDGRGYDESAIPDGLTWLKPAFTHCWTVVRSGYHRLLDFPVFRATTFVGGVIPDES